MEKNVVDWTPTATELWNDVNFISRRIEEQRIYIQEVSIRLEMDLIDSQRAYELAESARLIAIKFSKRQIELYGWYN